MNLTASQNKIKDLLRIEDSSPKNNDGAHIIWTLPNGTVHRRFGPAIIGIDGYTEWKFNGLTHREDGPAVEWADGQQEWWKLDVRHREDGPAVIIPNGKQEWWKSGLRHREDGPAIVNPDGSLFFYINGSNLTEEQFNYWQKNKEK